MSHIFRIIMYCDFYCVQASASIHKHALGSPTLTASMLFSSKQQLSLWHAATIDGAAAAVYRRRVSNSQVLLIGKKINQKQWQSPYSLSVSKAFTQALTSPSLDYYSFNKCICISVWICFGWSAGLYSCCVYVCFFNTSKLSSDESYCTIFNYSPSDPGCSAQAQSFFSK